MPVINGTGVLIHTNLGRAPLGRGVVDALIEIAGNYNNLEYDLSGGQRGGRAAYLMHNLAVLCGAQAACVVNNCAAALMLMVTHFTDAGPSEVVISRGELIQIGGGFRIPDILLASGAVLCEVGTTNKTSVDDYAGAIGDRTAMILKVHRSNFYMDGFVESPDTAALAGLARERGIPLIEDLGSGATFATESIPGVAHEPTPAEALAAGVDLVCFSGDKLLGGPQAGIIAGDEAMVSAIGKHPLFRALRCDKLILAALQATVDLHLRESSENMGVPIIEMMRMSNEALKARAGELIAVLKGIRARVSIGAGESQIGGGTLPRSAIASTTLDLLPTNISLEQLAARLRAGSPSVIGYISQGTYKLDLRTVFPRQDTQLVAAIVAAVASI